MTADPAVPAWLLAAAGYRAHGWRDTLPLPTGQKFPPPTGFTGYSGDAVTNEQLAAWATDTSLGNLALRLPTGIIGIDVDSYGDKPGARTIAEREREWGPLPRTWRTTSRWPDDGDSGIRLYRAPSGLSWRNVGPGVEVLHIGWRYAVTWPSVHPNGRVYCWVDEDSGMVEAGPLPVRPDQLPELPDTWVRGLSDGPAVERARGDAAEVPAEWMTPGTCLRVTRTLAAALAALADPDGESRHDVTTRHILALVGYGARGHRGLGDALDVLEQRFVAAIRDVRPGAQGEWDRMVHGAVAIVSVDERPAEHCHGPDCEPGKVRELPDDIVALATASTPAPDGAPAPATDENGDHPGWRPRDLGWLLVGRPPEVEKPTVLRANAGHSVFYAGRVNGIYGDPEAAKTWITLAAIADVLSSGGRAAFIDVDHNGDIDLAMRLHNLGAGDVNIADPDRLRLYSPDDGNDLHLIAADLAEWAPDVVVWDSIGEVVPMLGFKSTDNDEVTAAIRRILLPAAKAGSCVIGIDHLPKNQDARDSGYAIGGSAKKRAIGGSYVMASVVPGKQPAPGQAGEVRLSIEKDRPGELRRAVGAKIVGRFVLDSTHPDGSITWELKPVQTAADGKELPSYVMERISRWAEEVCSDRTIPSERALLEWARDEDYGRPTTRRALSELLDMGYFTEVEGPKRARAFRLVRAYRAADPRVFHSPESTTEGDDD